MSSAIEINQVHAKIQVLKQTAQDLERMADEFPALARNMVRILASIKMLEINVCDIVYLANND
jgi:hypothetical protein